MLNINNIMNTIVEDMINGGHYRFKIYALVDDNLIVPKFILAKNKQNKQKIMMFVVDSNQQSSINPTLNAGKLLLTLEFGGMPTLVSIPVENILSIQDDYNETCIGFKQKKFEEVVENKEEIVKQQKPAKPKGKLKLVASDGKNLK